MTRSTTEQLNRAIQRAEARLALVGAGTIGAFLYAGAATLFHFFHG